MDDAVIGMGVHPVETTAIGGDAYTLRNRYYFSLDIDCDMDVNMIAELFRAIAGETADGRIGAIFRDDILDFQVDETGQAQQENAHADGGPQQDACPVLLFAAHHTRRTPLLTKFFLFGVGMRD